MYPVSGKYKEMMDQDVREAAISLEMDLIRLDMDIQTSYSVTGLDEADYTDMLRVSGDPPPKKAALERDYMRADGSYTLADVSYYISPAMSGTTADSSGLYPIDSCGVTLVQQRGTLSPVSLVLEADPAVGKVQAVQGSYSSVLTSTDGVFRFTGLPGDSMSDITLTVLAMNGPQRRAHLYQVYMGTLETYGRRDILSAGYVDINDGICLELPQKTLSVTVDNLGGRYDPETEYTTPTFRKFHTQALVRMYVDQEVCSIGRWFLDTYTVDETSVAFHFVGPLAVMNEYPHLWSSTEVKTTLQRVEEIVSPSLELMDVATDKPIKSGAERYGITAECGEWVWPYNIPRPSPPVSGAQALQLLCNYANDAILQGRTWLDPQNNHATADLHIIGMGWIGGQREIPYRLMLGAPKWQIEDAVGRIRAEVYSTGSETTNETLADQFWLSVGYDEAVTAEQPVASVTVPPGSGGYGTALRTAAFAYAWYYTAQDESYYTPSPVTAQLHKIIKTPVTAEYGEGTEKTLSNPLLSNSSESSSSVVTVQNYLQRMYNEIKHNLTATLSHRGYPELDAGELVMVQTKPEGEYVECRVLENRWTLNGGALSGSTKVRRLA